MNLLQKKVNSSEEILLKESNPLSKYHGFDWIKVKQFRDNPNKTWEERFNLLLNHHSNETNFLINEVRKLDNDVEIFKSALLQCREEALSDPNTGAGLPWATVVVELIDKLIARADGDKRIPASNHIDDTPVNGIDWNELCGTFKKDHSEHWAAIFLACAFNHLSAALIMAGIDPNMHKTEMTIPDEDRANLQEVFCAWKNVKGMIKEISKKSGVK